MGTVVSGEENPPRVNLLYHADLSPEAITWYRAIREHFGRENVRRLVIHGFGQNARIIEPAAKHGGEARELPTNKDLEETVADILFYSVEGGIALRRNTTYDLHAYVGQQYSLLLDHGLLEPWLEEHLKSKFSFEWTHEDGTALARELGSAHVTCEEIRRKGTRWHDYLAMFVKEQRGAYAFLPVERNCIDKEAPAIFRALFPFQNVIQIGFDYVRMKIWPGAASEEKKGLGDIVTFPEYRESLATGQNKKCPVLPFSSRPSR